jgi:outer membrane protein OmpA-like peptidoglycan-associated protein
MRARLPLSGRRVAGSWLALSLGLLCGEAGAQWTISMRVMRNPLPVGECTYVEIVLQDAQGRQGPLRPDGKQATGWDFDFTVTASAPDAFRLKDDDPTRPFICATAPTAPSATFTAHYPGRHLQPNQVVPGVELWKSIEVAMAGSAPAGAAQGYAGAAPGYAGGGYPVDQSGYPAGAAAGSYPAGAPAGGAAAGGYASGGYPQPGAAQAGGYPPGAGYAQGAAPATGAAGAGYPQGGAGYPQGAAYPQGAGASQAAGYPQPSGDAPAGAAPPPDTGRVRTGKQFLQRITGHAKRTASEVATNTTTHVADAAGGVIGTTLEAGSDVVKSGAGSVTGAASGQVQDVGRALGAKSDRKDPEDVAAALAAGRAVLRGLRFTEGTAMLEQSSSALISQIAGALARTPGQFLIEAHVDGKSGAAAQALSEQRAAAVKAALVAAGSSPMQLAAVGYGATRPIAGAKSSARIEIARTQ